MPDVVPTACCEWSLNEDEESKRYFWWNNTYSISIWNSTLKLDPPYQQLTDTDVWRAFIQFQVESVYKLCPICRQPEGNKDMKVCYCCGSTVHCGCSNEATDAQIASKPANRGFESHLCACFSCEDVPIPEIASAVREPCDARRASIRALSIKEEYPQCVVQELLAVASAAEQPHSAAEDAKLIARLRRIVTGFFQTEASCASLTKAKRPEKGGGIGVVAAADIPAHTIIGVYPGYTDALSGEQAKLGRPIAKYALVDLNCADYFNVVFEELQDTFTPFINEPSESEESNCGWIQETKHVEGRLSVMTARDTKKGEELLIGYGPMYPRSYPYRYDAFAFHKTDSVSETTCFALWRCASVDENDTKFLYYVGYNETDDLYYLWDTVDPERETKAQVDGNLTSQRNKEKKKALVVLRQEAKKRETPQLKQNKNYNQTKK
ncbi:hypothetical protein DQ04_03741070 [Trypanosoma grayi]|uniref:hypothetical protein n=1 Tax=Trypanosoma grayi TaxID=71804 RepID=UPI0004F49D81|nr:hypothetical protein DQ04_03741070 [Trypanosoma grayi]KEG10414.1 hypothetical protein DQ04_03741070 [Trypanosoma grayi]